ncbi:MAG: HAD family hydrolase [Candidatus Pacebacteria bacterium]|nr:HAD family hydrolase [Candidatus Paceibacterota bacterium]PIR63374.1 MAG: hypothetical protein COU64_04845 [Candidatus Pacebacteria bacterium CG10_big_fil_rev_8_21_14_0_10_40_26]PIZ79122.1 MAG: hypothetical protein COY01_01710 [Candidatus Pacebacteria bacterium CG_4_10_14_0_2_um_filter_40_20]PJA69190.1 MAG: hypothetical protein CO156_01125 [Candidatus Pacebacteria bacterium CG_4_9_14_3_um_filter_40_12]PJC42088.1 MAG: hypothetical protein CO041_00420 [Candidatus Pacebacteria bacterium CG_4_9_
MQPRPTLEEVLATNKKKYLILDFDETLFKLHLPWGEYLDDVYEMLKNFDEDFFNTHAVSNESNYQLINKFTREFGSEPRDMTIAYAKKFEAEKLTGVTECHTQTAFVRDHASEYHFFIWTSNCVGSIMPILEKNNMAELFEKIVGRDTVTYCKPDPDGFNQIKEHVINNLDPVATLDDFMMIGDSNSDEGAAYHSDIDFYRVQ